MKTTDSLNELFLTRLKYLIYLNVLLDSVGWSMLIPVLPRMHSQLGMDPMYASSLSSMVSFITLLSSSIQGRISDVIGKTTMFQLSAITQIFGFICMMYALQQGSLSLFIIGRCIPASCKCGMVISQALLYDYNPDSASYIRDIGVLISFSNAAYVIGPIVGGILYSSLSEKILWIACIFCLLSLCSILGMKALISEKSYLSKNVSKQGDLQRQNTSPGNTAATNSSTGTASLIHLLHLKFAFQMGNCFFEGYFAQQAQEQFVYSAAETGLLLGWCGILSALTSVTILPVLTQWMGNQIQELLPVLTLALVIGLSWWGVTKESFVVILASSVISVASTLFLCVLQGLIANTQQRTSLVPTSDSATDDKKINSSETEAKIIEKKEDSVGTKNSSDDKSSSNSNSSKSTSSIGSVMGFSSTADRAARILSPIIGSSLKIKFGSMGIVLYSGMVFLYCFVLIQLSGVPVCWSWKRLSSASAVSSAATTTISDTKKLN